MDKKYPKVYHNTQCERWKTKTSTPSPYTYAPSYSAQCPFNLISTILEFQLRAKPMEFPTQLSSRHFGKTSGKFRDIQYCDTSDIKENVWILYAIQLDAFSGCSSHTGRLRFSLTVGKNEEATRNFHREQKILPDWE